MRFAAARQIEDGVDLGVLAPVVLLFEDLEPGKMGEGEAQAAIHGVASADDQLLVEGLDDVVHGLLDLLGDELEVGWPGGPRRDGCEAVGGGLFGDVVRLLVGVLY